MMIEDGFKLYHKLAVAIFERAILDHQKPDKKLTLSESNSAKAFLFDDNFFQRTIWGDYEDVLEIKELREKIKGLIKNA